MLQNLYDVSATTIISSVVLAVAATSSNPTATSTVHQTMDVGVVLVVLGPAAVHDQRSFLSAKLCVQFRQRCRHVPLQDTEYTTTALPWTVPDDGQCRSDVPTVLSAVLPKSSNFGKSPISLF